MAILLLLLALGVQTAASSRVSGLVTDATSLPLRGAVVEVDGRVVAITGESGAFEIVVTPGAASRLRVALDGFEPYETLLQPGISHVDVTLVVRGIEDRVRVTARPPRPPTDPVFARQPIDVYRTPGAQGDLFRALQTLPGVVAPDDAAGLFVRGGDVSDVLVSLDDAVIAHPYRYETPTGGFRGAVDPLLITDCFQHRRVLGTPWQRTERGHGSAWSRSSRTAGNVRHRRPCRRVGIDRCADSRSRRRPSRRQSHVHRTAVRRERQPAPIRAGTGGDGMARSGWAGTSSASAASRRLR